MRAVGYATSLPIDDERSLIDLELPDPTADDLGPHDLLVEIAAVSVNPIDTKLRMRAGPLEGDQHRVLGFDASGTVRAVGAAVTLFAPGDDVSHAGAMNRPGTNGELHVVDERVVGRKPTSLSHAEAAALPLTSITAWEMLFDGMQVPEGGGAAEVLLVLGGAGGVGSILTQLARTLTELTVVATASRPETRAWCERMGAHHVIDHHQPLAPQLAGLGPAPRYVAAITGSDQHFDPVVDLMVPHGRISMIDDPTTLDARRLKPKALTLHFESMFARPVFNAPDLVRQHEILDRVADLVDAGKIVTTANRDGGTITAEHLRAAHAHQESGTAIGKTVLAGF